MPASTGLQLPKGWGAYDSWLGLLSSCPVQLVPIVQALVADVKPRLHCACCACYGCGFAASAMAACPPL